MIFISYNHKDQDIVDMIARKFAIEFGRDNIFYDKWSMQPGDSILEKMNEGLEKVSVFFYFVSKNSLLSTMVNREWQVALKRSLAEGVKFIPVRVDDCKVPTIISDIIYVDLYGQGLNNAVEQMKASVRGEQHYQKLDDIENLQVSVIPISNKELEFKIFTTYFVESDVTFGFVCKNKIEGYKIHPLSESIFRQMSRETYRILSDGKQETYEMRIGVLQRQITPNTPFIGRIVSSNEDIELLGVLHIKSIEPAIFKELRIQVNSN
ncbi:toll/interleukin-1 receptor domain-containing protein [Streptococcus sp. E17BB]|uniref:toll/interleukin-1 receptor domain-containing protein n=1 Tax=Streptococcus sp. E17BB TaxID=3278714 RepID=UPI00359D81BF